MKKNERIAAYVSTMERHEMELEGGTGALDGRYLGYFTCFNKGEYYEAHDVLENLWLSGCGGEYAFYKGLIQVAGAFVHLRKQFLRPDHPKDGKRLRPAVRLFGLGERNLAPYGPRHLHLDVAGLCELCRKTAAEIVGSEFTRNPWRPELAPQVNLSAER